MESLPGLDVRPIDINIIGLRNDDAVQLTLTDKERSPLRENSDRVIGVLDNIPGTIEVTSSVDKPRRQIVVAPDREKLSFHGVNLLRAGQTLRTAFNGNNDLSFDEFGTSRPIRVILDERSRISIRDIGHLTVLNSMGLVVPFMEFSTIADSIAPAGLERTNRIPSITIKSQVIGRPAGTVSRDLMSKLEVTPLNGSPGLIWGGSTKRTQEGLSTMTMALAISMILVYLILVALYDSFFYPFVVLFSIPMAIIGALIALAMSMQTLSIFSIMGLIMLLGLVGKNAILVVDFTNKLKGEGMDTETALLESIKLRFRPILMTNLTMIIGLLPIALASGVGSEWKNGLAWVLIGGLSSSMLLTLVVVPVVFHLLDRIRSQYLRAT
jgi:multidrug efflux pump subunit AcrB